MSRLGKKKRQMLTERVSILRMLKHTKHYNVYPMTEILSVKVDDEKFRELEQIARKEQSDLSTVVRKLLDIGMKDWKLNKGVDMFRQGKISLWKGSTIAGVSLREFVEILNEKKIDWVGVSPDEVEAEVKVIKKRSR